MLLYINSDLGTPLYPGLEHYTAHLALLFRQISFSMVHSAEGHLAELSTLPFTFFPIHWTTGIPLIIPYLLSEELQHWKLWSNQKFITSSLRSQLNPLHTNLKSLKANIAEFLWRNKPPDYPQHTAKNQRVWWTRTSTITMLLTGLNISLNSILL